MEVNYYFRVMIMKIVVSDPVFLPEEYRKRLEVLGNLTVYESMPASTDELIARK